MDNGYDENSNPFANVSDEYAKKREEALKKQKQKKISARARQVRKVRSLCHFSFIKNTCLLELYLANETCYFVA